MSRLAHNFLVVYVLLFLTSEVSATCDVKPSADVHYFDVRLPTITVPRKTTHYVCQKFKVPDDDTFHAVAFEPLISNHDVMHHMLLFGCDVHAKDTTPHECSAADGECRSWLAQWTVGVRGKICTPGNAGVRFGKDSYSYMSLQVHWNNAMTSANLTDNSGFRIFYTTKMRQYDVGNVQIGQQNMEILPNTIHNETGSCSETCTMGLLPHPVYLSRTYIHMHYLGIQGRLDVYRQGKISRRIAFDAEYDYTKSPIHIHEPAIQITPGDEIRLTCTFDSSTGERHRNHTLYFGEGADSEMCYAFITYYPHVPGFDQCIQFDEYDINCMAPGRPFMGGCIFGEFQEKLTSHLLDDIIANCTTKPVRALCGLACTTSMRNLLEHPCMKGRLERYCRRIILSRIPVWKDVAVTTNQFKKTCVR